MEINGHNGIFVGGASGMALATAEKFTAGGGNVAILDLPSSDGHRMRASPRWQHCRPLP